MANSRFSFVHAADLHIDSPLAGLRTKNAEVAARFANAGRRAVEALIAETISSKAAFLIIAGDVFDGDWKDINTGLFFVRAIGDLHRAGIPAFIVKGNHDAQSLMSRDLPYPETVQTFPSDRAATFTLDSHRVALHGRSFPNRLTEGFVEGYPVRREGWLNVGVLHTSLNGRPGHEGYAPCSIDDLKRFGYDYWALGHVHAAEIVSEDPWIVFPGNLQGRSVRETGAKGAMRVTVEDGHIVDVSPLVLDGARWEHLEITIAGLETRDEVAAAVGTALAGASARSSGRPLAVRITLLGETALHSELVAGLETFQDEVRAGGFHIAADCWVEQVKVKTSPPIRPGAALAAEDSVDIDGLLAEAADSPEFAKILAELTEAVESKLPNELHDEFAESASPSALAGRARALLQGRLS